MEDTEGNNMVHFGSIDTGTSSQLRSPRVPWEVFDYIMDFLQNDMSTLLACAQSCRQLHASSVLYIYRNVSIQTAQQCVSFENTIKNNLWIGASVRTLLLDKRERHVQFTMPWVYNHLAMNLSASLPNCHTLTLAKIEDLWKERYFDNLTRFKSIRKLVLLGCAMAPQELYAFLGCFENLQELRIESFRELFAGRYKEHPVRFKPRLTRLRLDCENMPLSTLGNTFYQFILDTPTRDTLERISIMTYKTDIESTGEFLRSFGQERIVEIEVGFVRRYGFYGDDPLSEYGIMISTGKL
ncbi:hypothetical protein C8Q75DRAFT_499581 [Abortiporus biennis]|nr:hypothetical protein C8Q75DRAFT_499581 [Abortiporus biennis]